MGRFSFTKAHFGGSEENGLERREAGGEILQEASARVRERESETHTHTHTHTHTASPSPFRGPAS